VKKKKPKFLRKDTFKKIKIGRSIKKKRVWRRAIGRHNKIREKLKGYGKQPSVGYGNPESIRGKIKGLKPVMVYNKDMLKQIKEDEIAIVGKIGKKKKIEIAEAVLNNNIKLANLDAKAFLEKIKAEKKLLEKAKKVSSKNKEGKLLEKTEEPKAEEKKEKAETERKEQKQRAETENNGVKNENNQPEEHTK